MRPASIVLFEKVFAAWFALGLVTTALSWGIVTSAVDNPAIRAAGFGAGVVYGSVLVGLVLPLLLWFFIARRASNVAKWIFVILAAFSVLGLVTALANPQTPKNLVLGLNIGSVVLQLYAAWLLFQPDAKAWLDSKGAESGPVGPIS